MLTEGTNASKINLLIKCRDLPDVDLISKSDPFVVVYIEDRHSGHRKVKVGQTEVIHNKLNPVFSTSITVNYWFEEIQNIYFEVWDNEGSGMHKLIGEARTTLGDILGSRGSEILIQINQSELSLKCGGSFKKPYVIVRAEEVSTKDYICTMRFCAHNLDKKDFLGKSDPLLEIYKYVGSDLVMVHRTEYVKQDLNPVWNPFQVKYSKICNFNPSTNIELRVLDWNKSGKYSFIGSVTLPYEQLKSNTKYDLVNPKKSKRFSKNQYKNSGILNLVEMRVEETYTFTEYLFGGMQISLMVAIDFTASNGDPRRQDSLHFIGPGMNDYQQVIVRVGQILLAYDWDKIVPVYGFGGRFSNGAVSHCFHVNGDPSNPNVFGLQQILDSYSRVFSWIALHGPTNFAPVIMKAVEMASSLDLIQNDLQSYIILLIITDGEITDMANTIDAIVRASSLPLSIVIVGVGSTDFTKMEVLDGDDVGLCDRSGRRAERDIVQFVPFEKYKHDPEALSVAVLEEIPTQVVEYMRSKKLKPRERLNANLVVPM